MDYDYRTLNEVDGLLARMNTHPEYSSRVKNEVQRSILLEAAKHSYAIDVVDGNDGEKKSSRIRRLETNGNLQEAWDYLSKYGASFTSLAVLGNLVEPEGHKYKNFRQVAVMIGTVPPPSPETVPFKMRDLSDFLTTTTMHPILRSVEAHLEIARIHPYEDGNGRTARLVQNFCLQERGYPAPIIKESERQLYFKLLRQALKDRSESKSSIEKPSDMEIPFHEFVASKVLESARGMEEELKKRRMYEVNLDGCTKDTLFSTADRIRSFNRTSGSEGVSVRKERKGDQGTLYIMGDISKDQLTELVQQSAKRYRFKSSVRVAF